MKLDTLKISLLALVFALGFNGTAQSSNFGCDSDSDDEARANRRTIMKRLLKIGEEKAPSHCGSSYISPRKEAAGWLEKFNNGQQELAIMSLYGMLETGSQQRKLASGNALIQLIIQTNPKPSISQEKQKSSEKTGKSITLTADVDLNSCKIAQLIENFSRNFNARLVAKAEAGLANGGTEHAAAFNPLSLQAQMTQFSDLTFYAKLLEQCGVKLDFKGKGALDITIDPFGSLATSSQDCEIDKGTKQAIKKIIKAFECSPITPSISNLLKKVLPYGTPKQQKIIKRMIEDS
ncbi:hypothetical protein [Candidatus Finniella inopinata]|uniref:Uncharacterized protein n=1 Tax=Candidatus Finniella inopinata TaxID=1696036 RepID=A0A4Q7DI06_9PROT|nr:hypothetical protein [Candidatus Finniella inopinata]RZI46591.1 hypothetical protein EQU50_03115 [Candidatus Finniella inopinata]